jgi:hypothetical protein
MARSAVASIGFEPIMDRAAAAQFAERAEADVAVAAGLVTRNEKAPATRAAYRSDFAMFREWCQGKGRHG